MKLKSSVLTVAVLFLFSFTNLRAEEKGDVIFQISTIGALIAGDYDGVLTYGDLRRHGNFGVGTFNELDGEMIELDGTFYQVKSDGNVEVVPDSAKTPFATVTFFQSDRSFVLKKNLSCEELEEYIETLFPTRNIFYAVKIEGRFGSVKTRSVPKQKKPYPPLTEVVKAESIFELENVEGTIVGFWMPDYTAGITPTGFHFHFITDSREAGGHVLDCITNAVNIDIDDTRNLLLSLPDTNGFYQAELSTDANQVRSVEKEKKQTPDEYSEEK